MENINKLYGRVSHGLQEIKEKKLGGIEGFDAKCALIEMVAGENPDEISLIMIREIFKNEGRVKNSDFDSILSSKLKKVSEEKKQKDREEAEDQLRNRIVCLADIHKLHKQISSSTDDLLEIALATMVSVCVAIARKLPVIWTIVAGAPSSDKTEHITSASLVPQVHQIDTLTPAGLASGYVDPKTGQKATKDYLLELDKGVLIIKDMASLFSSAANTVQKVLGDLTNIYDGQFKKLTGTSGMVGGDSVFSMACATTTQSLNAHHRYMAKLGPRFFTYRIDRCTSEQVEQGKELIWEGKRAGLKPQYKEIFSAYLYKLLSTSEDAIRAIQIPEERRKDIETLSDFLCKLRSYSRSWVEKDGGDHSTTYYDIQIEEPFRALQQLTCIAISFALIHGRNEVAEHDIEMMRRLVLGSGPADRVDVLRLFREPSIVDADKTMSIRECSDAIGRSYNRASSLLHELVEVELVETKTFTEGKEKFRFAPRKPFHAILTKPIDELDHAREGVIS